mgnify:CR=1 FL=1|tara:strand:+ start:111 stop:329 length:219 start_codon:yes stop_codon:yes gene_type:complete
MRKSLRKTVKTEKRKKTFLIRNIPHSQWDRLKVQKAVDGYSNIEDLFHDIIRYYGEGQLTLRRKSADTANVT